MCVVAPFSIFGGRSGSEVSFQGSPKSILVGVEIQGCGGIKKKGLIFLWDSVTHAEYPSILITRLSLTHTTPFNFPQHCWGNLRDLRQLGVPVGKCVGGAPKL
jgi:hypothetical protein